MLKTNNLFKKNHQAGYTIIEVIIVLTVSAALFATTVVSFNQQNRRTQYTESVETFAQKIKDVLNDVETGYYPTSETTKCSVVSGEPRVEPAGSVVEQGTNIGCTFLGKALHFKTDSFSSYTIVGKRLKDSSLDDDRENQVINLANARPIAVTAGPGDGGIVDKHELTAELKIISVTAQNSPGDKKSGYSDCI